MFSLVRLPESGNHSMRGSMYTPWGIAQVKQQLDEGVFWVKTLQHGGILIEKARARELLSERARKIGKSWDGFLAFEQEKDMLVVFYERPELYPWVEEDLTELLAEDGLRSEYPEYFQAS